MLEKRETFYYEEEEISLYDILEKILEYKKFIINTFILGLILSVCLAYFFRNYDRKIKGTQNFVYDISVVNILSTHTIPTPENILLMEKNIDKFLEIPFLKEEFLKNNSENQKNNSSKKIEFISKYLKVSIDKDKKYVLNVSSPKTSNILEKMVNLYFSLFKNEIEENLLKEINKTIEIQEIYIKESEKKLDEIGKEIDTLLRSRNFLNENNLNIDQIISNIAPKLWTEQKIYKDIYEDSNKKIAVIKEFLDTNKIDNVIRITSSLTVKEEGGIVKKILLIGLGLTIFFIVFTINFKEFIKGYLEYKKVKK